ncbi:putative disease resistance RPP13-like protein 2 isoform X2 [Salvia miltiorrhiza]|uniref:putative disease resistance RPP13-like protein 2 isoform X2 n=1 Tax=Salvia miltiorrhiza TaxID=226208 RepID=UPI0025AC4C23|nr:putative disease resistance RPP13-like protein 2 isoform X2 [Salvia miltiorrhiza]
MSEALLLSVIQELDDYLENNPPRGKEHLYQIWANREMERVIKEMREIVDIVRDKKLEEGRILNFFLSDLIYMANYILFLSKYNRYIYYKSILSWIGEIKKQMLKLGDDESNMRSSENVDDDVDVVGFKEEVEMLIHTRIIGKALESKKSMFKTVVIKGMSGSGKTTLAREIYNHPTVKKHFERRAWVSNSTHITLKELFIKLIQQVKDYPKNRYTSTSLENMSTQRLQGMVCQLLQGKRYLIVLDDVPKQMHLKSFLNALPKEIQASRCLFTSHMRHIYGHRCT